MITGMLPKLNIYRRLHEPLRTTVQCLKSDTFSRLAPELLQAIVILLPTSDVRSVRLVSPVFATLELPESFGASSFQLGHEFDYLPEVHDRPPESWMALYHSLNIWAHEILSLVNRRRVSGLAKRLQATLTQMDYVCCQGSPLGTWFDTMPSEPGQSVSENKVSWHTASRAVADPGKSFHYGSRVLRAQGGSFISGFKLVDNDGRSHALGYQREETMSHLLLPLDEPIQEWELAMDIRGVKGIAAVCSDETLTGWAGESAGLPRWRLQGSQEVSAVIAELDVNFAATHAETTDTY
ncbi:hypothetical protein FANTH_6360 [Fusarium anthophilum]|uniref:DUF7600 domain-containing protein n=1 Tax=Fusarium anthophilum TaxID=48485 RepID=A0A8H5E517_9HYPO|nr:hypothetical protein FANTH_6360 [Fusarium anthophilum]